MVTLLGTDSRHGGTSLEGSQRRWRPGDDQIHMQEAFTVPISCSAKYQLIRLLFCTDRCDTADAQCRVIAFEPMRPRV
jgi:hypothetical protein